MILNSFLQFLKLPSIVNFRPHCFSLFGFYSEQEDVINVIISYFFNHIRENKFNCDFFDLFIITKYLLLMDFQIIDT